MKKIFFFLCILLLPNLVSAEAIEKLEIKNGNLSRAFETNNNTYSVLLNENENEVKFDYVLKDSDALVTIEGNHYEEGKENIATISVQNTDGTKEIYTFYLEKDNATPVFKVNDKVETANITREIPHLGMYVGFGCFLIILFLFKILMLGFKKKH